MNILFMQYPSWTTVRKAKDWLTEKGLDYTPRHIINDNPSAKEIKKWHEKSGLDIDNFFSKNGKMFKELGLKDKLKDMSLEEKYELLGSDGKLCKRPITISDNHVAVGFKEADYEKFL